MGLEGNVRLYEDGDNVHLLPIEEIRQLQEAGSEPYEEGADNESNSEAGTYVRVGRKEKRRLSQDAAGRDSSVIKIQPESPEDAVAYILGRREEGEEHASGTFSKVKLVEAVYPKSTKLFAAKIMPLWGDIIKRGMGKPAALLDLLKTEMQVLPATLIEIENFLKDESLPEKSKKEQEILKKLHQNTDLKAVKNALLEEEEDPENVMELGSLNDEKHALLIVDKLEEVLVYKNTKGIINIVLIMPYIRGEELFLEIQYVVDHFSPQEKRLLIMSILKAYRETVPDVSDREQDILAAHGDVKPENIMIELDADGCYSNIEGFFSIHFIDFGLAVFVDDLNEENKFKNDKKGTVNYFAPEMHAQELVDQKIDVYALGLIFLEIATGVYYSPENKDIPKGNDYSPQRYVERVKRIMNKRKPDELPLTIYEINTILNMLKTDPAERTRIENIYSIIENAYQVEAINEKQTRLSPIHEGSEGGASENDGFDLNIDGFDSSNDESGGPAIAPQYAIRGKIGSSLEVMPKPTLPSASRTPSPP